MGSVLLCGVGAFMYVEKVGSGRNVARKSKEKGSSNTGGSEDSSRGSHKVLYPIPILIALEYSSDLCL